MADEEDIEAVETASEAEAEETEVVEPISETEAELEPADGDDEEEVVISKMDATPAPKKPVRVVEVRSHPEISNSIIGKKSNVESGVYVGQELTLEQINRFSQKTERLARGDDTVTRAEMKRMTRRRGRSLR